MFARFIIAICLLSSCTSLPSDDLEPQELDSLPKDVEVRFSANSWDELVSVAKPSATLGNSILLWCTQPSKDCWVFGVSQVFKMQIDDSTKWMVFNPPDNNPTAYSDIQGLFLSEYAVFPTSEMYDGPQNYAELVGKSDRWGELYKVVCFSLPGGARANEHSILLLVWRMKSGEWKIIWEGGEDIGWHMGGYNINEHISFTIKEPARNLPKTYILLYRSKYFYIVNILNVHPLKRVLDNILNSTAMVV